MVYAIDVLVLMMPKFISIGQKILMLILALLFATVSILTIITLKDSQAEIEKFQVKSIAANVSDYHVINDLFILMRRSGQKILLHSLPMNPSIR